MCGESIEPNTNMVIYGDIVLLNFLYFKKYFGFFDDLSFQPQESRIKVSFCTFINGD